MLVSVIRKVLQSSFLKLTALLAEIWRNFQQKKRDERIADAAIATAKNKQRINDEKTSDDIDDLIADDRVRKRIRRYITRDK